MTAELLTIAGLILDIAGVLMLFRWAPEKFPDPQSTAFFAIEDDSRDRWRDAQVVRRKRALLGVWLLVVGFALQAIAVLVSMIPFRN